MNQHTGAFAGRTNIRQRLPLSGVSAGIAFDA